MKAAIINKFGSASEFEIKNIQKPSIANNEVLIKVMASSVNPVDWKHRKGNHKLIMGSKFPIILGYDVSGIIVETGSGVLNFKVNDKVNARLTGNYGGAYAEYAAAIENILAIIPDTLDFLQAAAIPLAGVTALQGLRDKGNIRKGQKVLIIGAASGVGHIALQLAKYFETEVTVVCSSRHNEMMEKLQPYKHIDYNITNIRKLEEKYDIIFDIVGKESFLTMKHLLIKNGTYITTLPRLKVLVHKFLSIFTKGLKAKTFLMKPIGKDIDILNKLVANNKLQIYIDKIFKLDEIQLAHEYSETEKAAGKIVIDIIN